jgi:glycosyltransferase involved in cell wall biosynthesis
MKIVFIVDGTARKPIGGHKMVYEYASRLSEDGYDVCLCFRCDRTLEHKPLPRFVRRAVGKMNTQLRPRWFELPNTVTKRCIFSIADDTVPDADCVFATAVETAHDVAALSPSKGRKYYLIQGYENWVYTDAAVRATYRLGMQHIVVSSWLKELVDAGSGCDSYLISNAVDTGVFYSDGIPRHDNEVGVLFHPAVCKGFDDAFEALMRVKQEFPELVVNAFGTPARPHYLPGWFRYTCCARQDQTRELYNRSAAFVCGTVDEGFGLTGLESMACGCTLVSTDYLGVREYARDGFNAMLSPVRCPELLAGNLLTALRDPLLRSTLGSCAQESARTHSWDKALGQLEGLIGGNA